MQRRDKNWYFVPFFFAWAVSGIHQKDDDTEYCFHHVPLLNLKTKQLHHQSWCLPSFGRRNKSFKNSPWIQGKVSTFLNSKVSIRKYSGIHWRILITIFATRWFQPISENTSQIGSSTRVGVKTKEKNLSNHHPVWDCCEVLKSILRIKTMTAKRGICIYYIVHISYKYN